MKSIEEIQKRFNDRKSEIAKIDQEIETIFSRKEIPKDSLLMRKFDLMERMWELEWVLDS